MATRDFLGKYFQAMLDRLVADALLYNRGLPDGIERAQVRRSSRTVETKFGEVELERNLYQSPGVSGLAPLDAAMELAAEKYSLEVRRIVAEESARASFGEVVELVKKQSGAEVPRRQVEELAQRAARDFDAFYQARLREPEDPEHLLILSFDGKGIAMRLDDLRDATRKAAEATPRRMHTRLAKGEKANRKRMAEVAAVYSLQAWPRTIADVLHGLSDKRDADRPRPTNKRVWASVEHTAQRVIDDAFAEALRRDPARRRRWVVLVEAIAINFAEFNGPRAGSASTSRSCSTSFTCSNTSGARRTRFTLRARPRPRGGWSITCSVSSRAEAVARSRRAYA
jgi:hypothetical protein